MKITSRIFLVLFALLSVVWLGYYAFVLTIQTLTTPFVAQEKQTGTTFRFVLGKPTLIFGNYDMDIFDTGAMIDALSLNGKPFNPTLSGEWYMSVSGEYVEIGANNTKEGDVIRLDSSIYNQKKTKPYRIPSDFSMKVTNQPKEFYIQSSGLPREKNYTVTLGGYDGAAPESVRFYAHTSTKKNCYIADAWDSREFRPLRAKTIQTYAVTPQIQESKIRLDYDENAARLCIIAGIGGDFYTVEDRRLDPFTATGVLAEAISPEYDMKSRLEMRFSSDIYADTGVIYSPEYIENRRQAKLDFLSHLSITPSVPLTVDMVSLSPDRASIVLPLDEWKKYSITLDKVSDIYGRHTSLNFSVTPKKEPFLSLWLKNRSTMFRLGESIDAKLYFLKPKKQAYTLKLCRISLEWYAKTERIIAEEKKQYTDALYALLESKDTSDCVKKDITVTGTGSFSSFDVRDFLPSKTINPGFYILAFRDKEDVTGFDRFVSPRVFSVIDSQVTMKIDASGKMAFLITDIRTGKPLANQNIRVMKNISKTYSEKWDEKKQQYITEYLPLSTTAFATGMSLWLTDVWGFLSAKKETLIENDYASPYGLSTESSWEEYEWQYSSFLAVAEGQWHFSYVVSTWNDGITGWNFGLKDSDYSYFTRPLYSAYIHTDRKLYLPWEQVFFHAIIRKNENSLTLPANEKFTLQVSDSNGAVVSTTTLEPNEFGTISTDYLLPKDAPLWSYTVSLSPFDSSLGYIDNSYTQFQVEVFKNPTFTALVSLQSPDVEKNIIRNLRKNPNVDPNMPWYTSVYEGTFSLEWIVKAKYYNGAQIRWVPFRYRVYRAPHYDDSYWNDCFWWCYWEPSPEFYTEWTGSIDTDGFWFFRVPVAFSSIYSDYTYTAEIMIEDPLSHEQVTTPATLLVKLPAEYKEFVYDNPLLFVPERKILVPWENIVGKIQPQYGKLDADLIWKYRYELVHRVFQSVRVDDLRLEQVEIPTTSDTIVATGVLSTEKFTLQTKWLPPWEYHVRLIPITQNDIVPPDSSISDALVYVADTRAKISETVRVIPEKTVYHMGEKARVMITTPFTGGFLYITRERGWVIDHEYVASSGSTLIREYPIDDTMIPNIYIWVVAFPATNKPLQKNYSVGYGEIVTDMADKKWSLSITPSKETYTNRETANIWLTLTDRAGNPLEWEVAVMVVDESLIRLLGNIDLDIIPKFYQKFPFTMKTALTAIGMERNRFLSRKWANGWSGDKGGGWVEIASRMLFKNTAYYNPSIRTGKDGKAKVSFITPDNTTEYRVIAIGQTKNSVFAVSEKTIAVHREYTLDTHAPMILRAWDTTKLTVSAFNATKKITSATLTFQIWTGSSLQKQERTLILWALESKSVDFPFTVPTSWTGDTLYSVTLKQEKTILDSIAKTIRIAPIPRLWKVERIFGSFTGNILSLKLPKLSSLSDPKLSSLQIQFSRSLFTNPESLIRSLISYPYGCIEQTIGSTLPNAIALKFSDIFGISLDAKQARENLAQGVQKILRMQYMGWWKYWENDTDVNAHVTPYVLRMLLAFRSLSVDIPQASIDAGVQYLSDLVDFQGATLFENDPDFRVEVFFTLAQLSNKKAESMLASIDPKKLSRHGYLAYAYGLSFLGKLTPENEKYLSLLMSAPQKSSYWYWDDDADRAIYAQFLLRTGKKDEAFALLSSLARTIDIGSYFVPTQTKLQILLALLRYNELSPSSHGDILVHLRSGVIAWDISLSAGKQNLGISYPREKFDPTIEFTREGSWTLFYEILSHSIPKDIYAAPEESSGMTLTREFASVNESRGIDENGHFVSVTPMKDRIFHQWKLYQVKLTLTPSTTESRLRYYLTLEDFFPGAWRPIASRFKTESVFTQVTGDYWSHTETKDDRLLATMDTVYSAEPRIYTYYFRPEYLWTYLLPPAIAYYMYERDIYAIGKYEEITIQQ